MGKDKSHIRENYDMTRGELFFHLYIAAPLIRAFFAFLWLTGLVKVSINGVNLLYRSPTYLDFRDRIRFEVRRGRVFIVASNHENRFHTIVATWLADNVGLFTRKVVKDKYYKNKLVDKVLFMTGSFPIDINKPTGDRKALAYGIKCLKDGYSLLIFPEGTRGGQEIFDGAGYFAEKVRDNVLLLLVRITQQGFRLQIDLEDSFDLSQFPQARRECIQELSLKLAEFFKKSTHTTP